MARKYRKYREFDYKAKAKDGVIIVWMKTSKTNPKDKFEMAVSIAEIEKCLRQYGNSNWVIYSLVKPEYYAAHDRWVENTRDAELREERRRRWENDAVVGKGTGLDERAIDFICKLVREAYKEATGEYPQSWFGRVQKCLSAAIIGGAV